MQTFTGYTRVKRKKKRHSSESSLTRQRNQRRIITSRRKDEKLKKNKREKEKRKEREIQKCSKSVSVCVCMQNIYLNGSACAYRPLIVGEGNTSLRLRTTKFDADINDLFQMISFRTPPSYQKKKIWERKKGRRASIVVFHTEFFQQSGKIGN